MPSLKRIFSQEREKVSDHKTISLIEDCSAIIIKKLPLKMIDPDSFKIPYAIGNIQFGNILCELGASINLIPLLIFKRLGVGEAKTISISLKVKDRSIKRLRGLVEDVLEKVENFDMIDNMQVHVITYK